ncbi:MAG: hypothetical protein AAGL69_06050 [Pseudomonadota bacterium]
MNERKRTKYEKLTAVNARIGSNFARLDSPGLKQIGEMFGSSGPGLWERVTTREPGVTRSQIAAGLEQGLRDLSGIVANQPTETRAAAVEAFRDAVEAEYPEFFERDRLRLAKILERQRIRTESDYYVVQYRLDEIEGDPAFRDEVDLLWALMDNYAG